LAAAASDHCVALWDRGFEAGGRSLELLRKIGALDDGRAGFGRGDALCGRGRGGQTMTTRAARWMMRRREVTITGPDRVGDGLPLETDRAGRMAGGVRGTPSRSFTDLLKAILDYGHGAWPAAARVRGNDCQWRAAWPGGGGQRAGGILALSRRRAFGPRVASGAHGGAGRG